MQNCIYINKENLIYNLNKIKEMNKSSRICAMVKANAYGLGSEQVAKALNGLVDFFGVYSTEEAKKIRKYTSAKILIVGACEFAGCEFSYSCSDLTDVESLINLNLPINIHLKINTGMNRLGFSSLNLVLTALKMIKNSKLNLEGVYTHFATTDSYVKVQYKRFKKFVRAIKKFGYSPIIHADNSGVNLKYNHSLDMVRVGYSLYGAEDPFKQVMEIESHVLQVNRVKKGELVGYNKRFIASKKTNIAVVCMGYADGLSMGYLGLDIKVDNHICKIVNICMDCFMLDVGELNIKKGDRISIVNSVNPLKIYADYLHTSCYEVMCRFSFARAKRFLAPLSAPHHKHK